MKLIVLVVFIFSFLKNDSFLIKEKKSLYYSNDFPWYVFYNPKNNINCDIVEIGGIKYGFIDKLIKINDKDTISKSKEGVLFYKNEDLFYFNYKLDKEFKLKKIGYKSSFTGKRKKIFTTYAFLKIKEHSLSDENKGKIYKMIDKDFEDLVKSDIIECNEFRFEKFLKKSN
ncbi:hypothetical protein [Flavobacterium lacisediminis]|uniref:Uncharacterized protein n=1 Tax=Flavobacterium lacisediminis TaxID=2989705 RepID=A0ABT3EG56_9FLAO|nr:hypothetical protein [Flavobacterium lacisediminis]MCW1147555.1 hypothetical protein [Flavobacterium lacisediminis]